MWGLCRGGPFGANARPADLCRSEGLCPTESPNPGCQEGKLGAEVATACPQPLTQDAIEVCCLGAPPENTGGDKSQRDTCELKLSSRRAELLWPHGHTGTGTLAAWDPRPVWPHIYRALVRPQDPGESQERP